MRRISIHAGIKFHPVSLAAMHALNTATKKQARYKGNE